MFNRVMLILLYLIMLFWGYETFNNFVDIDDLKTRVYNLEEVIGHNSD